MARKPTQREWMLIGVLAVALVVALYAGRGGGFSLGRGSGKDGAEAESPGEGPRIELDRLSGPAEGYDPKGRNLFAYWTPPPPPPPKLPSRPAPKPVTQPVPKPKPPPQRPPATRRDRGPKPPTIGFAYIGYLGPKDDKIAVFEQGEEMWLARSGEVVRDHFKVVGFGYETVKMGYTDERFKDRVTELQMSPR